MVIIVFNIMRRKSSVTVYNAATCWSNTVSATQKDMFSVPCMKCDGAASVVSRNEILPNKTIFNFCGFFFCLFVVIVHCYDAQ